jgi:hypothetical protein
LLRHLALLRTQPLHTLELSDAACLGEADSAVLASALNKLPQLAYLSLGGSAASSSLGCANSRSSSAGSDAARPSQALGGQPTSGSAAPGAAPAAAAASAGINLPCLPLVAAAVAMPSLQHLELSLTFGRQSSYEQQQYLHRLGCVLHAQRRLREAQGRAGGASGGGMGGDKAAECSYSRVSVTVHEHLHGDLSAGGRLQFPPMRFLVSGCAGFSSHPARIPNCRPMLHATNTTALASILLLLLPLLLLQCLWPPAASIWTGTTIQTQLRSVFLCLVCCFCFCCCNLGGGVQ